MFYWLYEHLSGGGHSHISVLNLIRYLTFRTAMSIFTAQLIVVAMGSRFIRWMQAKQGKGQPIRVEGIQRHITEKAGTPTMGGVMILAGLIIGTLLWADLSNIYVWAVLLVTAGYGLLGFLDDYSKVTKRSTDGISGKARLVMESAIAMAAIALIILFAAKPPEAPNLLTSVAFPLLKGVVVNLSWFYLVFGAFVIVGAANAVNFTDGLDGLATVPVMIAAAAYGLIAYLVGNFIYANYLQLHFVPGVGEIAIYLGHDRRWPGFPLVQRAARPHLHGRHRLAGLGRRPGRGGRGHAPGDHPGPDRRPVRRRDPVGDHPGRLVQADRAQDLPDGPEPPPFRKARLVGVDRRDPLLDRLDHAGPAGPGHPEAAVGEARRTP